MFHYRVVMEEDTETFSYVVWDPSTKQAAVIDPVLGFEQASGKTNSDHALKLLQILEQEGLTLVWIMETHAHADHLSAAPFIKARAGGQIVIGEHIVQVQEHFKTVFGLETQLSGQDFDALLTDGQRLKLGELEFEVMHVPGHTFADCAYKLEDAVFVGDTLFMPDVGTARCDFPGGSAEQLYESIQRILTLPANTRLFMCHDYPKDREHEHVCTVADQLQGSIHVNQGVTKAKFVSMRVKRDQTLGYPRYILPSIQLNIRAGKLPEPDALGRSFLKIPLNALK